MQWNNRIILARAGSGKTTSIVDEACSDSSRAAALVTYTINGAAELSRAAHHRCGHIPPFVTVSTWFVFLLRHFIRPYQNHLYAPRISRINFNQGQSAQYVPAKDIARHYFSRPGTIYRDKISKFACAVIQNTGGLPLQRFERIFDRLFIDESQDIAGFDLELIELLMKSRTAVTMVGDHRQATYTTNDAKKNKRFARANIVEKFREWEANGLCEISYQTESQRCVQAICDFADLLYPHESKTSSRNNMLTGHDGVFAVRLRDLTTYQTRFKPQPLRYNRTFEVDGKPINYGNAKGMTFERTLIYPHGPLRKFLTSGRLADAGNEIPKLYVAITRARQSTAFVVDNSAKVVGIPVYEPGL